MTLNLGSPWLSRLSRLPKLPESSPKSNYSLLSLLLAATSTGFNNSIFSSSRLLKPKASLSEDNSFPELLLSNDEELLGRVSAAKDANEALEIIAEVSNTTSGVVSVSDCCRIITAALDRNNADLALSVFYAMRSNFDQGVSENGPLVDRWKWSRPDVSVYTLLVQGLASSLKVSDALKTIDYICRVGVSPGEEVPFGKVVRCPTCMVAIAVAQPQHGIQIASCAKCRYQYELVSGDITTINSEEIRNSSCRTQQGPSCMGKRAKISADHEAKHSGSCSFHCGFEALCIQLTPKSGLPSFLLSVIFNGHLYVSFSLVRLQHGLFIMDVIPFLFGR